jgi:hypothetical protein
MKTIMLCNFFGIKNESLLFFRWNLPMTFGLKNGGRGCLYLTFPFGDIPVSKIDNFSHFFFEGSYQGWSGINLS